VVYDRYEGGGGPAPLGYGRPRRTREIVRAYAWVVDAGHRSEVSPAGDFEDNECNRRFMATVLLPEPAAVETPAMVRLLIAHVMVALGVWDQYRPLEPPRFYGGDDGRLLFEKGHADRLWRLTTQAEAAVGRLTMSEWAAQLYEEMVLPQ
jgi:hypothetical protein